MPCSGTVTRFSCVHFGQVGHPKPDPVRRTKPPVTTIKICETSEAQAQNFRVAGPIRRSRKPVLLRGKIVALSCGLLFRFGV